MLVRRLFRFVLLVVLAVSVVQGDALAAVTHWNTDNSGQFGQAANWDNEVPDGDDTAVFRRGAGADYTVTFLGSHPVTSGVHYFNDRLRVGSNTVSLASTLLATYNVTSPALGESDRGVIMGELPGDTAILNLFLSLNAVAATIGDMAGADGTVNVHSGGAFNISGQPDGTLTGDAFPFDGLVNIDDLNSVRNHFGARQSPVPETSTFILLAVGLSEISGRRLSRIMSSRK